MVVQHQADKTLMDREALALWTGRSPRTIRARCTPCGTHHTGRKMYHAEQCADLLKEVPTRERADVAA